MVPVVWLADSPAEVKSTTDKRILRRLNPSANKGDMLLSSPIRLLK
jgi:hypothetical protein